jgi:hypothetical protein
LVAERSPLNSPAAESSPSRPVRREIVIILIALFCGVAILPPIIFFAGSRALGAYAGGDIRGFMTNFFRGLAEGSFAFWAVAFGPYVLTVLLRLLVDLARRSSSAA